MDIWNLVASHVPCSCKSCCKKSSDILTCEYKKYRNIVEYVIKEKNADDVVTDAHDIQKLTCALLREER